MATNTSAITVTELDFDLIKQALIDYFKSNPTFSDYNFEGSALNILTDILAYNTHMNAVMANMSANELFLDSAQLRQSIVSIAKTLSYTPRSKIASLAEISITFNSVVDDPPYVVVSAGTRFGSTSGYIFSTKEQYLAYPDETLGPGFYTVHNVEIFEGLKNDFSYLVDYSNLDQRFIIPSVNADMTSLVVTSTAGMIVTPYSLNENITVLDSSSVVYFLHENPDEFYEVTFGDDIIGKKPINGSTVTLSYIISTAGSAANNISKFTAYQPIDGYSTYSITCTIKSYGAAEKESKESIQLIAPNLYKAQSRAVVVEDYESFMLKEYSFIETLSIWGGEYNEPPVYGKVFLAIKPIHTEFLSDNLKAKIKTELIKKYNVVTVIPEIVDPQYLYINIDVDNIYSKTNSIYSESEVSTLTKNSIITFSSAVLQKFNKPFYYSSLLNVVTNSEPNIVSSLLELELMMKIFPMIGVNTRHFINFNNAIKPGSVNSSYYNSGISGATAKQGIYDNGLGIVYTKNVIDNNIVFSNIGTVDYDTGILDISFKAYSLPFDTLDVRIYTEPKEKNVFSGFNQILVVDNSTESQDYNRKQGITVITTAENLDYK